MSDETMIDKIAHILTGLVGATCCHKTGGKLSVHTKVNCECRAAAREIYRAMIAEVK